jgi:hypothetical protein
MEFMQSEFRPNSPEARCGTEVCGEGFERPSSFFEPGGLFNEAQKVDSDIIMQVKNFLNP